MDLALEFDADEKVLELLHSLARVEAPDWYMNLEFKLLFADDERKNLGNIAAACQLELADTMTLALNNNKPPSLSFFQSLPEPIEGVWGIYAITMEQPG